MLVNSQTTKWQQSVSYESYLHTQYMTAKTSSSDGNGHGHAEAGDDGYEGRNGRRGSVIAEQYEQGMRQPRGGGLAPEKPPSNEEVAKAVQQKVAVSQSGNSKGSDAQTIPPLVKLIWVAHALRRLLWKCPGNTGTWHGTRSSWLRTW